MSASISQACAAPVEHRTFWGGDKWAFESMAPGDHVAGSMYPIDGGGEMTLLFSIEGSMHAWDTNIGKTAKGERYGVEITLGPLGTVEETHCEHPCALSTQPWWEPWMDRLRSLLALHGPAVAGERSGVGRSAHLANQIPGRSYLCPSALSPKSVLEFAEPLLKQIDRPASIEVERGCGEETRTRPSRGRGRHREAEIVI